MRGICRIFKVGRLTLAKWLKKAPLMPEIEDTLLPAKSHDVLERDKVWSFVKRRSDKRWLWIALCRRTRQVVAYALSDRSEKSCQTLWNAIPEGYKHLHSYSDFWDVYQKSFPKKLIVALARTLDKPIMSNDGIIRFDNGCLAIPVKRCLFQSLMNTILG